MQSSPTTVQILEGLRVELRQTVLPEVGAGPARVAVEMLDNVLSNLATRAAHEIAWMRDESDEIDRLADEVDDPATRSALAAYRETDRESLHLADCAGRLRPRRRGAVLCCRACPGHERRGAAGGQPAHPARSAATGRWPSWATGTWSAVGERTRSSRPG